MNAVERAVGVWLHRRIVRHPRAHAALLNQYRASEDFGRRFPRSLCASLLEDGPLKAKYRKHQADEERHERTYATRIRALGEEVREVGEHRDYMLWMWREAGRSSVGVPYARFARGGLLDRTERMRLWALQTAVEERGLEELALHRVACEREGNAAMLAVLDAIEPDERHHAEYSRRALDDAGAEVAGPAGTGETVSLLAAMREAEHRAYLRVTAAFLVELEEGALATAGWLSRQVVVWTGSTMLRALRRVSPEFPPVPASPAW